MAISTLRGAKHAATAREYARIYDHYNIPPRDIHVVWGGITWVRIAWTHGRNFGWSRWAVEAA